MRSIFCVAAALAVVSGGAPEAETLYRDTFAGPTLSAYWKPAAELDSALKFVPTTISFGNIGGVPVGYFKTTMSNDSYAGFVGGKTYNPAKFTLDIRFNTIVQSSSTSIDSPIRAVIVDAKNKSNFASVYIDTGYYSRPNSQNICFHGIAVGRAENCIADFSQRSYALFQNNTWYHLVIFGSQTTEVKGALVSDSGDVLFEEGLGFTLSQLPNGFRIGFIQDIWTPGSPYPTAAAINSIRLDDTLLR